MEYIISKETAEMIYEQKINIEWGNDGEPDDITYYDQNNGEWSEVLQQSGWSYQDPTIQEEYIKFLNEIEENEFLFTDIAFLEENEEGTSGELLIKCLGED